jgi:hypothetical protein
MRVPSQADLSFANLRFRYRHSYLCILLGPVIGVLAIVGVCVVFAVLLDGQMKREDRIAEAVKATVPAHVALVKIADASPKICVAGVSDFEVSFLSGTEPDATFVTAFADRDVLASLARDGEYAVTWKVVDDDRLAVGSNSLDRVPFVYLFVLSAVRVGSCHAPGFAFATFG